MDHGEKRPYQDLPAAAQRQYSDAVAAFAGWKEARAAVQAVRGGMYWKKQGAYEYLVRTSTDNRQKMLGPRSDDTQRMKDAFDTRKTGALARYAGLSDAVHKHERRNRVERVGRVPTLVVQILKELDKAGLSEFFTVVGTHSLYAYEAKAGVRFEEGALATRDVDLLWDSRQNVRFFTTMGKLDTSMLALLQRVDKTFVRREMQLETAQNADGFEVDFLRQEAVAGEPHPVRLSKDEEHLWIVQAKNASQLLSAPRFTAVVVAANGEMTEMTTIEPARFVAFKRWLAAQKDRDPVKRARDALQADVVGTLSDEFFV
ncbi:MAG: hypothetical protein JWP52_1073 [Rhizobacter sp.]|nr:hypothetical protein [Rhizobacter sp.]